MCEARQRLVFDVMKKAAFAVLFEAFFIDRFIRYDFFQIRMAVFSTSSAILFYKVHSAKAETYTS